MQNKKTFIFNAEWHEILAAEPPTLRLEILEAIIAYGAHGTLADVSDIARLPFLYIKKEMDRHRENYDRTRAKHSEAGKKAMAARYKSAPQTDGATQAEAADPTENTGESTVANSEKASAEATFDFDAGSDATHPPEPPEAASRPGTPAPTQPPSRKEIKRMFAEFRDAYPGRKRAFEPEFENLRSRHRDWAEAVPLMMPALESLIRWNKTAAEAGMFVPQFKNLSTWINQRCWTEELPSINNPLNLNKNGKHSINHTSAQSNQQQRNSEFVKFIEDKLATGDTPQPDLTRYY